MNGRRRSAVCRPVTTRARAVPRLKRAAPARKRTRGRTPSSASRGLNPRVATALDSMSVLAEYARGYVRGTPIPEDMWAHAHIVGEYLGYPAPERWLWQWLNGPRETD